MNIHVSDELKAKHPEFEFRGKPWEAGGFTWITGFYKILQTNMRFCIELECGVDPAMYQYIVEHGRFA